MKQMIYYAFILIITCCSPHIQSAAFQIPKNKPIKKKALQASLAKFKQIQKTKTFACLKTWQDAYHTAQAENSYGAAFIKQTKMLMSLLVDHDEQFVRTIHALAPQSIELESGTMIHFTSVSFVAKECIRKTVI